MDYLTNGNSLNHSRLDLEKLFYQIYNFIPSTSKEIFLGLNLQWPKFDLPNHYRLYFLSFHTEYLDVHWITQQAARVYPKPVTVVTDYAIDSWPSWPDNVQTVAWITTHKQIKILQDQLGTATDITCPSYKLSSLSYRISQYKKFVSAYLLSNFDRTTMLLTYHAVLGKTEDLHDHPPGYEYLDSLDTDLDKTFINFQDNFAGASPVDNGNWLNPAYLDALFNLTNESFHYSGTVDNNVSCCWPGPYITEKTFKPLLAARPFVVVGQFQTYEFLQQLGFCLDFGIDISYDRDPGDLTRIGKIFKVLDSINRTPINELFDCSVDAAKYNLEWIRSHQFYHHCEDLNRQNLDFFKDMF